MSSKEWGCFMDDVVHKRCGWAWERKRKSQRIGASTLDTVAITWNMQTIHNSIGVVG